MQKNVRIFMEKSLTFCNNIVIISLESKKSRMWLPSHYTYDKEVVLMIEQVLLQLVIILFVALGAATIIAFALVIALVIIISK